MSTKPTNQNSESQGAGTPVVLIVDDELEVARTYKLWLVDDFEVRIAGGGEEALEKLDEKVDVVLLDRRMPDMAGDEVLEKIHEQPATPKVAMVTAVDPDFDIIEMGFDDYVTKPPTEDQLRSLVNDLLSRSEYSDDLQKYHALLAKRETLREELNQSELKSNEKYTDLQARIETIREDLGSSQDRLLNDAEFVSSIRDIEEDFGGANHDG